MATPDRLEFRFSTRKPVAARLYHALRLLTTDGAERTEVVMRALVLGFYAIAKEREDSEPGLEAELRELLHHA